MKRILITLALTLAVSACGKSVGSSEVIKTSFKGFRASYDCLQWEGAKRCYYTVLPNGEPKHLMIALHPAFTSVQLTEDISHIAANIVPDGYVVVFPEGIDKQWNDGRIMTEVKTYRQGTDDVGFINKVTRTVQKKYGFTPKQTALAGMSNGGMMSMRMACQSDVHGAVATIVANLPDDLRKSCSASPKPMLLVFGTHDTVVDYSGGALAYSGVPSEWGFVESAKRTEEFFATRNGCNVERVRRHVIHDPEIDATRAVVSEYQGCKQPLYTITVEGMGHTWPGEESRIFAFLSQRGVVTHQFDAAKTIKQFVDTLHMSREAAPKGQGR